MSNGHVAPFWSSGPVFEYPLLLLAFPAAMAFAGAMDLLTMTIPNRISLALGATFLIAAPFAGLSLEQFGMHLASFALILVIGVAMFAAGWLGGGDAKLMAVAALWVGYDNLLEYFTQVAVLGGILALAILAYRRMPASSLPLKVPLWAERLHQQGTGMPYGIAIAGAALAIYPKTPWFMALTG